jgi:hypothetical protein
MLDDGDGGIEVIPTVEDEQDRVPIAAPVVSLGRSNEQLTFFAQKLGVEDDRLADHNVRPQLRLPGWNGRTYRHAEKNDRGKNVSFHG